MVAPFLVWRPPAYHMQAKGAATFNSSVQQIPGHPLRFSGARSRLGLPKKHLPWFCDAASAKSTPMSLRGRQRSTNMARMITRCASESTTNQQPYNAGPRPPAGRRCSRSDRRSLLKAWLARRECFMNSRPGAHPPLQLISPSTALKTTLVVWPMPAAGRAARLPISSRVKTGRYGATGSACRLRTGL